MTEPVDYPPPEFVLKAADALAPGAIKVYMYEALRRGLHEHAAQVELALREMVAWQNRHPELVRLPFHTHVPARPAPPSGG